MFWSVSSPLLSLLVALGALLVAARAVETARTPQGAVAWSLFILAVPALGIFLYLIFGNIDHRGFRKRRRAAAATMTRTPGSGAPREEDDALAVFERLAERRAETGNGVELLIDGEATYDAFEREIGTATSYVLVQFYIIRDDAAGQRLKAALMERARAGVAVRVLHDAFRGLGLPRDYVRELREAGVAVKAPRGPRRPLGRFQVNYRNHRKLIVVDGRAAFIGGLNIGDEHVGSTPAYGQWRDTHCRATGPVVAQLQESFGIDWYYATKEDLNPLLDWSPPRDARDVRAVALAPAPTDPLETGNLYFCALAQAARRRLWITTPYFVPDTAVLTALKLAALRGIELRFLVPDRADHYLPWLAAFAYFDEVRQAGASVWRYEPGFMHQKVALVDDRLVSIGTLNLDMRSGLLNFEQTVVAEDGALAAEVEAMLERDFAASHRMTKMLQEQPVWLRVAAPAARLLAPVL